MAHIDYGDKKVKKIVRNVIGLSVAAAGILAVGIKDWLDPILAPIATAAVGKKFASNPLFKGTYIALIIGTLGFLSRGLVIFLADLVLSRKSDLHGWWLYGFKVTDTDSLNAAKISNNLSNKAGTSAHNNKGANQQPYAYVVGMFKIDHHVSGITINVKGQSDYLIMPLNNSTTAAASLQLRGYWNAITIKCTADFSDVWILYHFEKQLPNLVKANYSGLMHFETHRKLAVFDDESPWAKKRNRLKHATHKWGLMKKLMQLYSKIIKLLHPHRYHYIGDVKDLKLDGTINSQMFAEKLPKRLDDVNDVQSFIIKNAKNIQETIDSLKTY